ncbi:MAG: hypothetical protein AAFV87_04180, partial [Pseudomonadota bacterium]
LSLLPVTALDHANSRRASAARRSLPTMSSLPEYDFNDEAIPAGCSWWAEIVERRMPAAS